jgi:YebC/PmpR family DNA-binding regulatory protein
MSGHSKWHSIKHKKGANDAKRGKVFTMHAKLIAIAARAGGDPDMNPGLRTAIDRAKADNVPNANIDRAVKKGSGADKDAASYVEITYEALGPEGSAFMIDCITDNKNRTLTNVRTLLTKNGGTLGSSGSVAWKFDKKAFLLVDSGGADADEAELSLIDCGADDLARVDGKFELYAAPDQLNNVKKAVAELGYTVEKDELIWKAKEDMKVSDVDLAKRIMKLMDAVDSDDDVNQISSNVDFDEEVMAQL